MLARAMDDINGVPLSLSLRFFKIKDDFRFRICLAYSHRSCPFGKKKIFQQKIAAGHLRSMIFGGFSVL